MSKRRNISKTWQYIGLALLAVVTLIAVVGALTRAPAPVAVPQQDLGPVLQTTEPTDEPPVAAFIGDSYSSGAGASSPEARWTTLLAEDQGWVEKNFALGGTGYLNTAGEEGCGKEFCENYLGVVEEVIEAEPDIVMVSGGRNDRWHVGKPELERVVSELFTSLAEALPDAKLIAVSPVWDYTAEPAEMAQLRSLIESEAEAAGWRYIDIGQPFEGKPELLGPDGVHPNDEGYAVLAETVAKKL